MKRRRLHKRSRLAIVLGITVTALPLLLLLILNTQTFISKQNWKYRNGFYVGDWVKFESSPLQDDRKNLLYNGNEIAEVSICLGNMLIIKNSKTGETGYYINK